MLPKIAQVVVGLPLETHFDYTVPEDLQKKIKVGQRVKVSFHGSFRVGYIIGLIEKSDFQNLKPVLGLLEDHPCLDPYALKWTKLFSEHYACSWGEAVETSLPTLLRKPRSVDMPQVQSPPVPRLKQETTLVHAPSLKEGWGFVFENIEKVRAHGQSVIILVPEVYQIEDVLKKLKEKISEPVAVLDKQLKDTEELTQWLRVKNGEARIIVGTRSAVFAPAVSLGAIIIFEEESDDYKQEQSPAYHAQIIAHLRAFVQSCRVILVSVAPSAEIWWQAQEGQISKEFFAPKSSAAVQLFDLSNYGAKQSLVSFPLRNLLEKTLAENGKTVLFMNRKGFSMVTRCNKCGHALRCPRCEISLTYLYSKKKMVCRRCQFSTDVPKICPNCKSTYLRSVGTGIEKLESEIARVFPMARIARYEKETTQVPKNANVIIATQAIRRVLNELSVDVLAVLQFDAFLNRMDFRTANKVFSLVVGLCHSVNKKVVLQTFQMDNYCVKALQKLNFEQFYDEEIKLRRELNFPPFSYLITIMLRGKAEETVWQQAQQLFDALEEKRVSGMDIMEPQADTIAKLRDQYRFTLMIKTQFLDQNLALIKAVIKSLKRKPDIITTINVDP